MGMPSTWDPAGLVWPQRRTYAPKHGGPLSVPDPQVTLASSFCRRRCLCLCV